MARPIGYGPHTDWVGTLSQWDAWGCPSILISSPLGAFTVIYNSDHPLGAGLDMDVLHHTGLISTLVSIAPPFPPSGL
jgi:hypothetical protein